MQYVEIFQLEYKTHVQIMLAVGFAGVHWYLCLYPMSSLCPHSTFCVITWTRESFLRLTFKIPSISACVLLSASMSQLYNKSDWIRDWYRHTFVFLPMSFAFHINCNFLMIPAASPIRLITSVTESAEIVPPRYTESSACCRSVLPNFTFIRWLSLPIHWTSVFELFAKPAASLVKSV